jgi:uncharacterized protein (TIGR00369 family)
MAKDMDRWLGDGGMPIIAALGCTFDGYGDGWATATWTPTDLACNPHGYVQAGVHDVVLDAAMNFAINASLDGRDRTRSTIDLTGDYLRAALEGATFAVRGEVTRVTKQIAFAAATVSDGDGNVVSRASGRFLLYRDEDGSGTSRR